MKVNYSTKAFQSWTLMKRTCRALREELAKVRFELEALGEGQLTSRQSQKDTPVKATFYKSLVGIK